MVSLMWIVGDWKFVASLAAVAFALLYHYTTLNFDHWKKRGIPEVNYRPLPFFGHMWKLMLGVENINIGFSDLYESMGDQPFCGFMQSLNPALLVKDPELIKTILIKDAHIFLDRAFHSDEENDPLNGKALFNLRGRRWKEMRTRLSPTFTSGRMKAMFPLMVTCAEQMVNTLRKRIESGQDIVEIKDLTSCYTMDVIATCGFGIDCDAQRNPESSEFRRMGKLIFKTSWKRLVKIMFLLMAPKIMTALGLRITVDETAVFFRNFVKNLVEVRERAIEEEEKKGVRTKQFGDFVHHLLLMKKHGLHYMRDERDENEDDSDLVEGMQKTGEEPSWTTVGLDDITAQVMIFFSAGFETSASLLSFTLYELTVSESGLKIQKELREEIKNVTKEYDGKVTYEGIKKMHLLDRILSEALRLYPVAGVLTRRNTKAFTIPETNYTLEPYTQVFIPTFNMQRDPKLFPDPMRFDPDRFLPENKEKIRQHVYIPFGDGPRHCIGQRFAELQARVGLVHLISNFEFDLCREKTQVPIKFDKRAFILTAVGGVWLKGKRVSE